MLNQDAAWLPRLAFLISVYGGPTLELLGPLPDRNHVGAQYQRIPLNACGNADTHKRLARTAGKHNDA